MARTVEQISKELAGIYDPQRQLIAQQQAQLPGQYEGALSSLEQAKVNAFKDITTAANRRGMYFSGVPVSEQATYTGTKYLPAVANLKQSQLTQQNALQAALNELTGKQMTQAQNLYSAELQAEQEAAAKRYAAELEAQQKELDRQAKIYAAQIKASSPGTSPASKYKVKQSKSGGFSFYDETGAPVTAAQYASATGKNISDILAGSSDPTDKKILNAISKGVTYEWLAQKYPYVFGGV